MLGGRLFLVTILTAVRKRAWGGGVTDKNGYNYIGSLVTNTIKSLAHAGSGLLWHIKASRPLSLAL